MNQTKEKWKVYLHILKSDNRAYCGITKQAIHRRWANGRGYKKCPYFERAIKKYGWDNFAHVVLYTVDTREEACALEQLIIHNFKLTDQNYGFNIHHGGIERDNSISPEGLQRLHDTFIGGNSPCAKRVIMFDTNGNRIGSFETAKECASYFGVALGTLSQYYLKPTSNSFRRKVFLRYEKDLSRIDFLENVDVLKEQYSINRKWKKINQYDLSGKYLHTFKSVQEAASVVGINCQDLSSCLTGNLDSLGHFMWRYFVHGEHATDDIEPYKRKIAPPHIAHSRPVVKVDPSTNEIVESFISMREASDNTQFSRSTLFTVLQTRPHMRDGFKWMYEDEYQRGE